MGNAAAGGLRKDSVNVFKDPEYGKNSLDLSHLYLRSVPPDLSTTETEFAKLLLFNNYITTLQPLASVHDVSSGNMRIVPSMTYLRHLDVSFNALTEIPVEFFQLLYLRHLDVGYNNIEEIDKRIIDDLTSGRETVEDDGAPKDGIGPRRLKVFNARYNKLTEFPALRQNESMDASAKQRPCHLEVLDLSGNELVDVPVLERFTNLKELHLQYNKLDSLAGKDGLSGLEAVGLMLKVFNVSHNCLEELPHHRLIRQESLEMHEEEREAFNEKLAEATNEETGVNYTEVEIMQKWLKEKREEDATDSVRGHIDRALGSSLETLIMSTQEVEEEEEPGALSSIFSALSAESETIVEEAPPEIKYNMYYTIHWATNITTLHLSNMNLVDASFREPNEVQMLIDDPGLSLKPDCGLSRLHHVTDLDLSINNLEVFPAGIAKMMRLQFLNLSHNKLVKADQFATLHKLEVVDLSYNALLGIPVQISQMINVKRLRLNNNHLRQLPGTIKDLVNLQELNLNSNLLTSFPSSLGALRLQHFSYFDNERLENPPLAIQQQGPEAVLAYMRARIKTEKTASVTNKTLYIELWGKEGEIGSVNVKKDHTLKDVREQIDLMVDEAPDRYSFVHNNRAVAEAAEERELAVQYLPMIQLRDENPAKKVSTEQAEIPDATRDFHSELIRQLRNMHMHKKYEFTVKDGQDYQVFSLEQ